MFYIYFCCFLNSISFMNQLRPIYYYLINTDFFFSVLFFDYYFDICSNEYLFYAIVLLIDKELVIIKSQLDINQKMFCILPCAAIKDKVVLSPIGPAAKIISQMDKTRGEIRKLSDTKYLISILQKGEVIMMKKIMLDNYLKSHVDLMSSFVSTFTPCNFIYNSYFTSGQVNTTGMSAKDQWAVQIVMARLNISSIYHAGAFNNMRVVFMDTAKSYKQEFTGTKQLIKNIQINYQYFNQAYQPLKRLLPYFDAIESLASVQAKNRFVQLNRHMFQMYTQLVTCNLAYLKIQKLRLLNQYKTCKQACYAVYLRIVDNKMKLAQLKSVYNNIMPDILQFFSLAQIFYQIMTFYFMLVEHDIAKDKDQYGFIKKQFQQMIYDNMVVIEQAERLMATQGNSLKSDNDNVRFGLGVLNVVMEQIARFKYIYNISVHENKMEKPKLFDVLSRRIGSSNILNSLDFF